MQFLDGYYEVYEDAGSVTLCATSQAEVELRAFIREHDYYFYFYYYDDFRAIDGEDYDFPNHNFTSESFYNFTSESFYNFTLSPGETRCFEISIIDDNIAEHQFEWFHYYLGIYDPYPDNCDSGWIYIYDNDGELYITTRELL